MTKKFLCAFYAPQCIKAEKCFNLLVLIEGLKSSYQLQSMKYLLYDVRSISSGSSVMFTSNLSWTSFRTRASASSDTNVIARPFVPKRPARATCQSTAACSHGNESPRSHASLIIEITTAACMRINSWLVWWRTEITCCPSCNVLSLMYMHDFGRSLSYFKPVLTQMSQVETLTETSVNIFRHLYCQFQSCLRSGVQQTGNVSIVNVA